MPNIYISYTWKDRNDQEAKDGKSLAEKLYETLTEKGYNCFIDEKAMEHGSDIKDYARLIGKGDLIIAILSEAYLRSPWCMQEMNNIYNRHLEDAKEIEAHLVPVVLPGIDRSVENKVDVHQFWTKKVDLLKSIANSKSDVALAEEIKMHETIQGRVFDLFKLLTNTLLFDYRQDDFQSLLLQIEKKLQVKSVGNLHVPSQKEVGTTIIIELLIQGDIPEALEMIKEIEFRSSDKLIFNYLQQEYITGLDAKARITWVSRMQVLLNKYK